MLISEFAKRAGQPKDTVRYYIGQGLLQPLTSSKGGRTKPYQSFNDEHLMAASVIRMAQSLGMPLKEIAAMGEERRAGRMTPDRSIAILKGQLAKLEQKEADLRALQDYLRNKIRSLELGETAATPDLAA